MSDGKIYITISDTRYGSGGGVSPDTPAPAEQSQDKDNIVSSYLRHRFFNFVEGQAKQFVNYSVNNIGNFTGGYQAQREIQATMEAMGFVSTLVSAAATGARAAGGWGALAGIGLAIGTQMISFGYQEYSEQFQNRKVNRNIDMMRRRLGLEGLTDGSRTGGY